MLISIIIPTFNRAEFLAKTLEHLARQEFNGAWEVIVVDNNCADNTPELVKNFSFPAPLHLVSEKMPGPGAARNAGAAVAKGQYLLFLDDDILTRPDFLTRHYHNLETYKGCWFLGHSENLPEFRNTPFGKFRKSLDPPVSEGLVKIEMITGQNGSLPREHFEKLGGFDKNFHVASGEDKELSMRGIRELGVTIYFDPSILVLHNDWAGTSIRDYCRRQYTYTLTEPYFWRKYGKDAPRQNMIRQNTPPDFKRDGLRLYTWKKLKGIAGSKAGKTFLLGMCGVAEKILPYPPVLWRLYRMVIAGAIYKGFHDGLKLFPPVNP